MIASYVFALRLRGQVYAVVVALLMCSLTAPYWIARWAVVDNLFYAVLPLFALAILGWLKSRSLKTSLLLALAVIALALTRPESLLAIASVLLIFLWGFLRRYGSPRVLATGLVLCALTVLAGGAVVIGSSPDLQKRLLSKAHISWGLAMSANTLLNRGGSEFDAIQNKYAQIGYVGHLEGQEQDYRMGRDAVEAIKAHPVWFVVKIPLRALALLFPWTYQPWSVQHRVYEALYTIFISGGLVLLARRYRPQAAPFALIAIPLAIWLFLGVYGIDNDLKHRNGLLVALNLIAPLGYFLEPRTRQEAARG